MKHSQNVSPIPTGQGRSYAETSPGMGHLNPAWSRPRLLIVKPPLRIVGIALSIVFGLQVGCGRPESLRARAEKGDANAQLQLGFRYYRGEGVPEDHGEAQ
jgi:hypothetical protein